MSTKLCKYCDGSGYHKYNGNLCRCEVGQAIKDKANAEPETVVINVSAIEELSYEDKCSLRDILDKINEIEYVRKLRQR